MTRVRHEIPVSGERAVWSRGELLLGRALPWLVAAMLAFETAAHAQSVPFVCGDADGSGRVTVADGVQALRAAAGVADACAERASACDVDGDGEASVSDGVAALRLAAELPTTTRCESPVTGDESLARAEVVLPGCAQVARESMHCVTIAERLDSEFDFLGLAVLGLDSGRLCSLHELAPNWTTWQEPSSLGWRGEIVYVCTFQGLVRISLRDGIAEGTQLPCLAATANDGAIFLMHEVRDSMGGIPWVVDAYASYAALQTGDVQRRYQMPFTTRMAASHDQLFGAWHSTDTVGVLDLASNVQLESVRLEAYDDWVNGIAVTDDGALVLSRWAPEGSIVTVFDAESGDRVRELAVEGWLSGLACTSRTAASME